MDITEDDLSNGFDYCVYTNEQRQYVEIDWSKLLYNHMYSTYEFYENKFPPGYENIPGFDKVIDRIAGSNINNTPLLELENLNLNGNNIPDEQTDDMHIPKQSIR